VLAHQLAEVDPRLGLVQLAGRRDTAGDPFRLATGLALVAVRRDHAEAVGVDGLQVVPVLVVRSEPGEVHLTHGDHGVGLGTVDLVSVHVQGLGERVVAADLL